MRDSAPSARVDGMRYLYLENARPSSKAIFDLPVASIRMDNINPKSL